MSELCADFPFEAGLVWASTLYWRLYRSDLLPDRPLEPDGAIRAKAWLGTFGVGVADRTGTVFLEHNILRIDPPLQGEVTEGGQ